MNIKLCLIGTALLLACANHANAATISYSDLPNRLGTEIYINQQHGYDYFIGGKRVVDLYHDEFTSILDTPNLSVFDFRVVDYSKTVDYFLIHYNNLDSLSSNLSGTVQGGDEYTSPIAGSAWLQASRTLNNGPITLYRDTDELLDPTTSSYYNKMALPFTFRSTAAAVSGSGYSARANFQAEQTGTMILQAAGFACCAYDITLNLIGLSYDSDGQASINPVDSRVSLLDINQHQNGIYSDITQHEILNIQPVPLPSSMGMFGSAMLLLLFRVKRCKKYNN